MKITFGSLALLASLALSSPAVGAGPATVPWMSGSIAKLRTELVAKHGESVAGPLEKGLSQVAALWRAEDGDAAAFEGFVRTSFAADPATREALFARLQLGLESLDGHMDEISRDWRKQADLDLGPVLPFDEVMAGYDPSAHVLDDLFGNRLAFTVLLNFPLATLEQRLNDGVTWSRRRWAEDRLAARFDKRIPGDVSLAISEAGAKAAQYIAEYNIYMHHVLDEKGRRLFPPKLRLLSHWNLRDEIKGDYADAKDGLAKQRTIEKVMERIVTQTIPASVVNSPHVDWNPFTNTVQKAAVVDVPGAPPAKLSPTADAEPDTRYATLLGIYQACRRADPYSPTAPSLIARRFDEDRQIPEARMRKMLEDVLASRLVPRVAKLIEKRLGRKLEPFDIWYDGFKARGAVSEAQLDDIVKKRFPTAEAYQKGIPELLVGLGFSKERAAFLAANIVVDPARGSGHAWGPQWRGDVAHLRTRVEKDGMNYKGFNIAVHEMGHNVEQVFSLKEIDYTLLKGVPNTAFTEALAMVFQGHDLELLGLAKRDEKARALEALKSFWDTYEISGSALVDMDVWRYMYEKPNATPVELRQATIRISKEIWNKYYAPVFGVKDVVLLGIYSHMIDSFLYLPDYPVGHMIAFQIEEQVAKGGDLGKEFERMARIGNIAPDLWMKQATGSPVGPEALLAAAEGALKRVQ